jgi:serine/threonine-protein kinase
LEGGGRGKSAPAVGSLIGEYLVAGLSSSGSEGDLLQVEHIHLHRRSALRLFPALAVGDDEPLRRFEREARILVTLQHPNLIETLDYGVSPEHRPYLVLEHVDGVCLSNYLEEHGRVPIGQAIRLVADLAAGLAVAHEHGLLHRGICSRSVMVATAGTAKLGDFGVAAWRQREVLSLDGTDGSTAGAQVVAPERLLGDEGDERADVFGLGSLLYELVVGRPPFVGDRRELVAQDPHGTVPSLPQVGTLAAEIAGILARCLARHPEDRFQSARELCQALSALAVPGDNASPHGLQQPSAPSLGQLSRGDRVEGRYRIEALRGRGGFGAVYRATQIELDRPVAIKVIHPRLRNAAGAAERFRKEAQALARLRHPGIVVVYDVGTLEDGRCFIAMEWVEGVSLSQLLRARGPLSSQRALEVMQALCEAVSAAHRAGIIHRDIKPSNVLVDPERPSSVKLVDFGIAKWLERPEQDREESGLVVGTPETMAPEQVRGEAIDERTDVYALGITFHWLLAGKPPFGADSRAGLQHAQLYGEPPQLPEGVQLRDELQAIVLRCLRKLPAQRYRSVDELVAEIRLVAGRRRNAALRRVRAAWVGGTALALTAALAFTLFFRSPAGDRKPASVDNRAAEAFKRGREALRDGRWAAALANLVEARAQGARDLDLPVLLGVALKTVQPLQFSIPGRLPVVGLAFSPDGKSLAVSRSDGGIEVWAIGKKRQIFATRAANWSQLLNFSPDGLRLLSGGRSGLALWEVSGGRLLRQLDEKPVLTAGWTRDGSYLLTAREDGVVTVRDSSGSPISETPAPGMIEVAIFDQSREQLIVVYRTIGVAQEPALLGQRLTVRMFDPGHHRVQDHHLGTFSPRVAVDTAGEYGALFIPEDTVAVTSLRRRAQITQLKTGDLHTLYLERGGRALLAIQSSGALVRWTVANGELQYRLHDGDAGHMWVAPDEKRVAVAYRGGVTVYDARDGRVRAQLAHLDPPVGAIFSPDGALLATATEKGAVYLWDGNADALEAELEVDHADPMMSRAEFVRGGVVFGGSHGHLQLWRGKREAVVDLGAETGRVATNADGSLVTNGNVIWSAPDGKVVSRLEAPVKTPTAAAVSNDGALAATGSYEGELRLWDAKTGSARTMLGEKGRGILSLAFRDDGARLAGSANMRPLRVWNTASGSRLVEIAPPSTWRELAFQPRGSALAGIRDTTLELYTEEGKPLAQPIAGVLFAQWTNDRPGVLALRSLASRSVIERLDGASLNTVWSYPPRAPKPNDESDFATVSPRQSIDGRWVIGATRDGQLLVLAAASGELLFGWRAGVNLHRIDISLDQRQLLALTDGRVRIWQVPREERSAAQLSAWLDEHLPGWNATAR